LVLGHADERSYGAWSREDASMGLRTSAGILVAVLAGGTLTACASQSGGDCVSHYSSVATAPTWVGLKDAMMAATEWGRVDAVRTQARGNDVGAGDEDVVRVVDLLDRNGRRLIQVDVWRTDSGDWRAGVWSQC
jgi:hypothetical protein